MSDRLEGFDNLPELQCNYCGVVFKGNHDCDYDILKERVEELQEKLKHQTDHRLSVENNNLKIENQHYREALEFYAASYKYTQAVEPNSIMSIIDMDSGLRARKALERDTNGN